MPLPPSPHGTANRWRTGCRCDDCNQAHLDDLAGYRRRRLQRRFPAAARTALLTQLEQGVALRAAAEHAGLPVQTVHAYAWQFPQWGELLDDALMTGRDPAAPHGTASGYRFWKCRCPQCRETHHRAA